MRPKASEGVLAAEFVIQDHAATSFFAAVGILLGESGGLEVEDVEHTERFPARQTLVVWLTASTITCLVPCDWDTHLNVSNVLRTGFGGSQAHGERPRLPVEPFFARMIVQDS